jgi:osmotically inducible protein OsmC
MRSSASSAVWEGTLKEGKGSMSSDSGVLTQAQYTFLTRFDQAKGTNPEELVAAAHAGCFSMALAAELGKAGFSPRRVSTRATVTLDQVDGKPTVTRSHLEVDATVPGISEEQFMPIAQGAKANCPVSRLLKLDITMDAKVHG